MTFPILKNKLNTGGENMDALKNDKQDPMAELSKVFVGVSHNIKKVRKLILDCAKTKYNVLILGETGTGKEIVANQIHEFSVRAGKKMVIVNVPELSESLIEPELFGYEPGAFTGATKRKTGLFTQAKDNTIFLDEIGDMPRNLQAKLLGVIERKEFRPVGSVKPLKSNFRLISATNRPIDKETEIGESQRFRSDLLGRLSETIIKIDLLKERKEDILPLMKHFLPATIKVEWDRLSVLWIIFHYLLMYTWPQNVRELKYLCQSSVIKSRNGKPVLSFERDIYPGRIRFDHDKYDICPPFSNAVEDCWEFEFVELETINSQIQEKLARWPSWRSTDALIEQVIVDTTKSLVSKPKYNKARQKYEEQKQHKAKIEKNKLLKLLTNKRASQQTGPAKKLEELLFGKTMLTQYAPTQFSIDEAVELIVKKGIKLPELQRRYTEKFLEIHPVTNERGEKVSSRAKQLGIDPQTLKKYLKN